MKRKKDKGLKVATEFVLQDRERRRREKEASGPHIEDTIKEYTLPVNSIAMLERLKELLREHETNCLSRFSVRHDERVRAVMWLMMQQVFGQLVTIDMGNLWENITGDIKERHQA